MFVGIHGPNPPTSYEALLHATHSNRRPAGGSPGNLLEQRNPLMMKSTSAWAVVFAGTCLLPLAAQESRPLPTSHTTRKIEGWTVHIDQRLVDGTDKPLGDHALRILANRLYDIQHALPDDKVERLRQVPIWIDRHHGKLRPAQYHPSVGWLKGNGYSEKLAKCVHIPDAADFAGLHHQRVQPWSVLHELAHAYHDQVLGFDHPEVEAAWARFRDSGKYKKSLHINGSLVSHYALTNAKEFFAEMTEAFFGQNDFFPFNRAELKKEEPETFALLEKIWGTVSKKDAKSQTDAKR